MKKFLIINIFISTLTYASSLKEIKLDPSWKIKFDSNQWSYEYLKPFNGISSHLLENKKEKFKLVLQKETHSDNNSDTETLLKNKCAESNLYYQKNREGTATVETINKTLTCYIEYKNISGNKISEFVFPQKSSTKNYELLTYVWISPSEKAKNEVINFLKGNVK